RLNGYGWDGLRIWPAFPANEHEFWLYVANTALEQKVHLPEFMMPVTDLGPIEERLRRWRRAEEIDRWRKTLGSLRLRAQAAPSTSQAPTDLRLVIGEKELRLQCQRPGATDFDYLKHTHLRQLSDDYDQGRLQLTTEADLLWQFFSHFFLNGMRVRYAYFDSQTVLRLSRLLRTRNLDSRIVNWQGQPLARPAEPLRWELQPAAHEGDDYRLRLVQPNGEPAPAFACVLAGEPALYVTEQAVF